MPPPPTKVFVGQLPPNYTSEELYGLFQRFGKVVECDVVNNYGFVHMATPDQAERAIKALNQFSIRGNKLRVEASKSELHPQPGAPGRARGGPAPPPFMPPPRFGGMPPPRNAPPSPRFGPPGPGMMGGGFGDMRSRYDFPPAADGFRERIRPYPAPYERRPPPPMGGRGMNDAYRRFPPHDDRRMDDMFERRPPPHDPPSPHYNKDFYGSRGPLPPSNLDSGLYMRRSPPRGDYWPERSPAPYPPQPIRRPYF